MIDWSSIEARRGYVITAVIVDDVSYEDLRDSAIGYLIYDESTNRMYKYIVENDKASIIDLSNGEVYYIGEKELYIISCVQVIQFWYEYTSSGMPVLVRGSNFIDRPMPIVSIQDNRIVYVGGPKIGVYATHSVKTLSNTAMAAKFIGYLGDSKTKEEFEEECLEYFGIYQKADGITYRGLHEVYIGLYGCLGKPEKVIRCLSGYDKQSTLILTVSIENREKRLIINRDTVLYGIMCGFFNSKLAEDNLYSMSDGKYGEGGNYIIKRELVESIIADEGIPIYIGDTGRGSKTCKIIVDALSGKIIKLIGQGDSTNINYIVPRVLIDNKYDKTGRCIRGFGRVITPSGKYLGADGQFKEKKEFIKECCDRVGYYVDMDIMFKRTGGADVNTWTSEADVLGKSKMPSILGEDIRLCASRHQIVDAGIEGVKKVGTSLLNADLYINEGIIKPRDKTPEDVIMLLSGVNMSVVGGVLTQLSIARKDKCRIELKGVVAIGDESLHSVNSDMTLVVEDLVEIGNTPIRATIETASKIAIKTIVKKFRNRPLNIVYTGDLCEYYVLNMVYSNRYKVNNRRFESLCIQISRRYNIRSYANIEYRGCNEASYEETYGVIASILKMLYNDLAITVNETIYFIEDKLEGKCKLNEEALKDLRADFQKQEEYK